MNDPYKVLGLERGASADDIKAAFRKQAKLHHPDANPGDAAAEERFKEISQAYETLTRPQTQNAGQGPHGFTDINDLFNHELFRAFRAQQEEMHRRTANADILNRLEISLEDAFTGRDAAVQAGNGQTYNIQIPRGINHGQRVRIVGAGLQRDTRYPAGDMHVEIVIRQHERFRRMNDVLVTEVEIDSIEAILGGEIELEMIDGERVIVPFHKGIQYGEAVRVTGRGMPRLDDKGSLHRGDLCVNFLLRTPTILTERHIELVNELQKILPAGNPDT